MSLVEFDSETTLAFEDSSGVRFSMSLINR